MKRQFTHGSLFAGIGGFDLGFERAGFKTVWQVEKEAFCRAVLKTHFPGTEHFEDVRDVGKHNLAAVDVLTFGFPCQDLSVAGKRAGLGGTQSGLFWEAARVLRELRPPWFLAENVPGLFSSEGGADFAIVLRELAELGYGLAWRVLNSQFFGVAQRRRRVFIVGCLGKPCPAEVLFEPEGGQGDFEESGEEGPGVAAPLTSGVGITGNAPGRRREDDYNLAVSEVSRALANSNSGYRFDPNGEEFIVGSLASHSREHGHAMSTQQAAESGQLIAYNIHSANSCVNDRHAYEAERARSLDSAGGFAPNQGGTVVGALGSRSKSRGYSADEAAAGHYVSTAPRHLGRGGPDDNDAQGGFLHVSTAPHSDRMRDSTRLPEGLDSARYRALGNAVTVSVAQWIAERIKVQLEAEDIALIKP